MLRHLRRSLSLLALASATLSAQSTTGTVTAFAPTTKKITIRLDSAKAAPPLGLRVLLSLPTTVASVVHDTIIVLRHDTVRVHDTVTAVSAAPNPPTPAPNPLPAVVTPPVVTAPVVVTPPVPPPSSVPPSVLEDFSTYTSTAQMLADPRGIYQTFEDINPGWVSLDTTVGYGASRHSMRYDYPDRTNVGGSGTSGRCTSATTSRSLRFPNDGKINEVWVELMAKTSTNFVTQAPASWGCTSDQGLKFADGNVTPGDRFSIGLRTGLTQPASGQLWFGYPDNVTDKVGMVPFASSANAVDGQWHQYRCHWKISTGYPNAANADGRITCWVDGALVVDEQNIKTTSTAGGMPPSQFYGLALARNMNQGPNHPQSLWWGSVKIYATNPGW